MKVLIRKLPFFDHRADLTEVSIDSPFKDKIWLGPLWCFEVSKVQVNQIMRQKKTLSVFPELNGMKQK